MGLSPSEFVEKWGRHLGASVLDHIFDDLEYLDTSSFGPPSRYECNEAIRARARFGLVGAERSRADSAADPGAQLVSASVGAEPPPPPPPPVVAAPLPPVVVEPEPELEPVNEQDAAPKPGTDTAEPSE